MSNLLVVSLPVGHADTKGQGQIQPLGLLTELINQGKFTLYQPFQNGIISEEVEAVHGSPTVVNGMLMGKLRYKLGQKTIDLTDLGVRQTVFQLIVVVHRNNPDDRPTARQI